MVERRLRRFSRSGAVDAQNKLDALVGSASRAPGGLSRVYYSDSGSTAVEIALKQAFQYCAQTGQPQRRRFIHLAESYHGDTLGAVGVGGMSLFHRVFGPLIVAGISVPTPGLHPDSALAALERTLRDHGHEVAAMVIEPLIQGAAGLSAAFTPESERIWMRSFA